MNMDQKQIDEILNGNTALFANVVDRYKNMVYTIAVKIARNKEDAEEIAQDTFVKAYSALKTFKGDAKFSTWLYKIAYNTAISKVRQNKRKELEFSMDETPDVNIVQISEVLHPLEREEQKFFLRQALDKLTDDEQLIITLFYLEEKSIQEVGDITGLGKSNVKVKLHRARKRLYKALCEILQSEIKIFK